MVYIGILQYWCLVLTDAGIPTHFPFPLIITLFIFLDFLLGLTCWYWASMKFYPLWDIPSWIFLLAALPQNRPSSYTPVTELIFLKCSASWPHRLKSNSLNTMDKIAPLTFAGLLSPSLTRLGILSVLILSTQFLRSTVGPQVSMHLEFLGHLLSSYLSIFWKALE